MTLDNNQQAFLEFIRVGLWENEARLVPYGDVDYSVIYQLAEEQSVVGLVLAGIERLKKGNANLNITQEILLQWIGEVQMLEQQNKSMDDYVAKLISLLRKQDVYAILVKGQGIAQCYERPLWRASGDVDLLLSEQNYEKAKKVLLPIADDAEREYTTFKHQGMTLVGGYVVELHGTMHTRLSKMVDSVVDEVQKDVFCGGNVRGWQNGNTQVFLPGEDDDVIFVFTHILHHFYIEGIGLRQICDWCRLLWTYRSKLDLRLLESRIRKMGLMSEWKAFASFAVEYLGMPVEAMPLYSNEKKWSKKAKKILAFVLEVGNFGQNRIQTVTDNCVGRKTVSLWKKAKDFASHARIFPLDSIKFFWHFLWNGVELAIIK